MRLFQTLIHVILRLLFVFWLIKFFFTRDASDFQWAVLMGLSSGTTDLDDLVERR